MSCGYHLRMESETFVQEVEREGRARGGYSASVLLTSVTWVVFGLCVVLPWALIGYTAYRVVRRSTRASRT